MNWISNDYAIIFAVFYYFYNTFAPYINFLATFCNNYIVNRVSYYLDYEPMRLEQTSAIVTILKINQLFDPSRSFINNDTKISRDLLKKYGYEKNKIAYGTHLIYIKEYGYALFDCSPDEKHINLAFLYAPKKFALYLKSCIDNATFLDYQSVNKKTVIDPDRIHPYATMEKKFFPSRSQQVVIDKIDFYVSAIFPKLAKAKQIVKYAILIHGPPGTGKTSISEIIAEKYNANIAHGKLNYHDQIDTREMNSASKINIFNFNELDLFYYKNTMSGDKVVNERFVQTFHDFLDNIGSPYCFMNNSIIVCTTNYLDKIEKADPAILSRFNDVVELPLLTQEEIDKYVEDYSLNVFGMKEKIDVTSTNFRQIAKVINEHFIKKVK